MVRSFFGFCSTIENYISVKKVSKLCRMAMEVPRLRQSQRQADKRLAEESHFPETQYEPVPKPVQGKGKG